MTSTKCFIWLFFWKKYFEKRLLSIHSSELWMPKCAACRYWQTNTNVKLTSFKFLFLTSNCSPRNWNRSLNGSPNSLRYHHILKCQSRLAAIRISALTLTDLFRHEMRIMFVLHYGALWVVSSTANSDLHATYLVAHSTNFVFFAVQFFSCSSFSFFPYSI